MKSFKKIFLMLTSFAMVVGTLLIGGGIKKTEQVEAATETVKYEIATTTSVTASGTVIPNSTVTYNQTYGTKFQMTSGKSTTLTIKAPGYKLNSLVLSMKSNKSSGAGSLSINGSDIITKKAFNTSDWHGGWSTSYVDVDVSEKIISSGVSLSLSDFSIVITASANSLYIQSYTIGYEAESAKVNYDFNGGNLNGSTSIPEVSVELGSTIENPGTLTHLTDNDKKFMGWYYTDSDGVSKEWNFATDTVTSNLTLTAKWGYEVTINPANGGATETKNVLEGTKISELVPTETPEKGGYNFAGWKKFIGTEASDITDADLVNSKLEIRADWTEITTPLVFIETEHEIHSDIVEYYVDQEFTLSAVVQHATATSYIWEIEEDDLNNPVLTNLSNSLNTKDIKFKANKIGDACISVSVSISEASEPLTCSLFISVTHPVTDIATNAWLGISYNDTREKGSVNLDVNRGAYTGTIEDMGDSKDISDLLTDSTNFTAIYKKNGNKNAYISTGSDVRLYPGSTNGSSIEITRNESSSANIRKVIVTFEKSGECGISINGNSTYDVVKSGQEYVCNLENVTSLSIKNITNQSSGSENQVRVTSIKIELQNGELKFTSIRARFGITIPADMYQFDKITSENVSFKVYVNEAENPTVVKMTDANKTINEDKSITYVVSVVNIPLANCKDVIHVVPTITINGHSYELAGTAYSVYEMVDAYLAQDEFKDNAYLTALKASIDAATNVA